MKKPASIPPERRQTMPEKGDLFLCIKGRYKGLLGEFLEVRGVFWFLQMQVSDVYIERHGLSVQVGFYPKDLLAVEDPPKHRFDLNEIVQVVDGPLTKNFGIIRAIWYEHERSPWHVSYSVDLATGANDVLFLGAELENTEEENSPEEGGI